MELQRFHEAVKDCSSAIDIDAAYLKAWHRRSKAYEGLDDMDRALRDVQKVSALCANDYGRIVELPGLHSAEAMYYDA